MIWNEGYWYLENFWHQFGNSLYIGLATMVVTVVIGDSCGPLGSTSSRHDPCAPFAPSELV